MQILKLLITIIIFLAFVFLNPPSAPCQSNQNVGDETCMECHETIYEEFNNSIHGYKGAARTPAALHEDFACESCHGPGAQHADEGDGSNIRVLDSRSEMPSRQRNEICLQCHTKGKSARWLSSTHEMRSVSCADCHSVHQNRPNYLAKSTEEQVCAACHQRVVAQLIRLSRHPIREGKMTCSDCHNTHGTIADKLVDDQTINQKCYECHASIRGPHLWEHPPVVEDCMTCHDPHGSNTRFLLTARPPLLCQRCHSNVDHSGALQARNTGQTGQPVYRSLSNLGYYRACLNCHSAVHGSNHPSGKALMR